MDSIRERLGNTTEDNIKDLFYNDNDNWLSNCCYVGKVVDNNDPDKLGRCRIRVFGVFTKEVDDKDLPWALPEFSFRGSKVGNFIVPPVDAIVKVYFDNGEIYLPIYTTKVIDTNNMPSQKDIDYPDNMVMFETDAGDYFTINRKSKVTTYNHSSGTKFLIDKLGNVTVENKIGTTLTYAANLSFVEPDPTKFGPFIALQFDPTTGTPLQGNTVTRVG